MAAIPTDWQSVLAEIESASARMIDTLDTRESDLDEATAGDEAGIVRAAPSRAGQRLKKLTDRIAAAEESARSVGAEIVAAESDLRAWHDQVRALQARLAAFAGR
jgi:septal ring factor EnvC (AmiA/AmiB activator)